MFEYAVPGTTPDAQTIIWSSLPLQPLIADQLTPFSYSVLAEIVSRAWYQYYDRLGFAPAPRPRLVQERDGQAYLNLTLGARLEAQHAAIEPPSLVLNGQQFELCDWKKPGLLGGFRAGRNRKKIDTELDLMAQELPALTEKARAWYDRTQELNWTQAEVLQVMEEIERVGLGAMVAFLAARFNLDRHYRLLMQVLDASLSWSQRLSLIDNTLCDLDDLVEAEIAFSLWQVASTLPDGTFKNKEQIEAQGKAAPSALEPMQAFLTRFGHRSLGEAETRWPRWNEDPQAVVQGLVACVELGPEEPVKMPVASNVQKLMQAAGTQSKTVESSLARIRLLYQLQSKALDALAYIWAGTRTWVQAAAREAMSDGRLAATDDIFYFELEEIKQMMTGEWNISNRAEIRSTVAQRRVQFESKDETPAPDILVGNAAGFSVHRGLPGVAGHAAGPLHRWGTAKIKGCRAAVIGAHNLTSGWSLALPAAAGFVAANGAPIDPFVAAARTWHRPVVVGLGDGYTKLVEGALTTVDGDAVIVAQ